MIVNQHVNLRSCWIRKTVTKPAPWRVAGRQMSAELSLTTSTNDVTGSIGDLTAHIGITQVAQVTGITGARTGVIEDNPPGCVSMAGCES